MLTWKFLEVLPSGLNQLSMEKMDTGNFLETIILFKGVWNRNCQIAVHPACCWPLASAAPGHLSFMRKTSPTAFEVKQENGGICMCLGCFVGSIQAETPLCPLLGILHYCTWWLLHQASTNTLMCSFPGTQFYLWELFMLFGKIKDVDPHTPTTFTLLCRVSQFWILLTVLGSDTLPEHSFHMWKQHLPEKPTFLSSILKGINRLKNYFRRKNHFGT